MLSPFFPQLFYRLRIRDFEGDPYGFPASHEFERASEAGRVLSEIADEHGCLAVVCCPTQGAALGGAKATILQRYSKSMTFT
jgi:hypothetical protein